MKKSIALLFIISFSMFCLSGASSSEVYKCRDKQGKLIYSDKKCSDKPEKVKIKKHQASSRPVSRTFFCPSGITAIVNNLHYPTLNNVNEAIRLVESDYTNLRYRKLIKRVDPKDVLPDRVSLISAEGFLAADVPGFSNGVVVNVKICK